MMPAVPRGDNPLMNMIMFKFGPPPSSVQVIAAIEVGENILLLFGLDGSSDDDHDRGAQEAQREEKEDLKLKVELEDANVNVFDKETQTPVDGLDEETVTARCRRCRWDSPEAWLVQSDSVDEEVSVAAMV
jgi:hypothetical protein